MTSGKNKRRQLEAYDSLHSVMLSVDSQEEVDVLNWLCEAAQLSAISDFEYQPSSFQLFDAVRYEDVDGKSRSLFQEHKYTPDFVVAFDGNAQHALAKELKISKDQLSAECSAWIDVKGGFNRNARSFTTDRKWVWDKFKTYICQLVPTKFFAAFGVPAASRLTAKTKKPRTCYKGMPDLSSIFVR